MSSNSNLIAHRLCTFGKFLKLFICGIEKVMLSFSGNLKEKMNWHRIVSVGMLPLTQEVSVPGCTSSP